MSISKRHHYLPRFYLEGFCKGGRFCVYDKNTRQFRVQTPTNTAVISDYYAARDADGNKRREIEEFLSLIETRSKPVIGKLCDEQLITSEERQWLAVFAGFMMARVPRSEEGVTSTEKRLTGWAMRMLFCDEAHVQAMLDRCERETGKKPAARAKEIVDFVHSDAYDIGVPRESSLLSMLAHGKDLALCFVRMNWTVYHGPPGNSFVTTDNPVVLCPPPDWRPSPYGFGILTPGARKVFPLDGRTCLIMGEHGTVTAHCPADDEVVTGMNNSVASAMDRFLIGRDEVLVRSVAEAANML